MSMNAVSELLSKHEGGLTFGELRKILAKVGMSEEDSLTLVDALPVDVPAFLDTIAGAGAPAKAKEEQEETTDPGNLAKGSFVRAGKTVTGWNKTVTEGTGGVVLEVYKGHGFGVAWENGLRTLWFKTDPLHRVSDKSECQEIERAMGRKFVFNDSACGISIGRLMKEFDLRVAVVSTPQNGPKPESLKGPFTQPVMDVHETLVKELFPRYIAGYDFAGSSSAEDCKKYQPDCDMTSEEWGSSESILTTQWFRYWSGRVRATVSSVIATSPPLERTVHFADASMIAPAGARVAFAFSVAGGIISQTEVSQIPALVSGAQADLVMRMPEEVTQVWWVHFACISDLVKALQGYGCVNFLDMAQSVPMGVPATWQDGARNPEFDVLAKDPKASPEERRQGLLTEFPRQSPSERLCSYDALRLPGYVKRLLEEKADPNGALGDDKLAIHAAIVDQLNVDTIKLLVEHRADLTRRWDAETPLQLLHNKSAIQNFAERHPDVRKRIDEIDAVLRAAGAE